MPDILVTDDPRVDVIIAAYYEDLRALSELALSGKISQRIYQRRVLSLAQATNRAAFLLAGGDEANPQAASWLRQQYQIAAGSARKLAADVFDGRYSVIRDAAGVVIQTAEAGAEALAGRLTLWTFAVGQAAHRGVLYQPPWLPDITGTWQVGDTEHCSTCLGQDGQSRTRLEWLSLAAQGIEPQGRGLECGGWKCQCKIVWETGQ
jgi:hypothetical protein